MAFARLGVEHEAAVRELLSADPVQNLFLLAFLDSASLKRGFWWGILENDQPRSIALWIPERLVVPWAPIATDAAEMGRKFRRLGHPCTLIGPRAAGDALWDTWSNNIAVAEKFYDQRLYIVHKRPTELPVAGFRRAVPAEWATVADYAVKMELEDLGRSPAARSPQVHEQVVKERIRNGATWVIEREGQIVFQINVGTDLPIGCQVGGTYVPPEYRGQGLAIAGMRSLLYQLLEHRPWVSLHVNEANTPAVQVYERVGFERVAAYRLITVKGAL